MHYGSIHFELYLPEGEDELTDEEFATLSEIEEKLLRYLRDGVASARLPIAVIHRSDR